MSFLDKIATKLVNLSKDSSYIQDSTIFFLTSENNKYNLSEGQVIQAKGSKLQIRKSESLKVAHAISEKGNYFWISSDKVAYSIRDAEILFKKELGIVELLQKKSSYLSVTKKANWGNLYQENTFNKISNRNVQQKLTGFLQNYLQNFEIHGRYAIKYDRLRNASTNENGYINKADVHVGLEIRSISGVKIVADLVVPVREGEFVEPSVITYNGTSHIIAQSAFDEITNSNTFQRSPQRSFAEVMSPALVEHYRNTKIPLVQFGMFR